MISRDRRNHQETGNWNRVGRGADGIGRAVTAVASRQTVFKIRRRGQTTAKDCAVEGGISVGNTSGGEGGYGWATCTGGEGQVASQAAALAHSHQAEVIRRA